MAVDLPSDLIVHILSWLPSKSLIHCRLVCKSWMSLISSTQFRLMHLHNFNQRNSHYLVRRFLLTENMEVYAIHFDDQYFTLNTNVSIDFPFNRYRGGTTKLYSKIIGCCNGIICLFNDKSRTDEMILWNPSIKKTRTLIPPIYRNNYARDLSLVFGFGYHKVCDDYKIVRLAYDCRSIARPQVEIYTVKTAIWRRVVFPNNFLCFSIFPNWSQVFLNESVHWISCDRKVSHCSILSFDVNTELFGEIKLPECLVQESPMRLGLTANGDSLGVIYYKRLNASSSYMVWVMKEYKKPMSWTMIYNVQYLNIDAGRALGLRSNGDLITESRQGELTIYNEEGWYYVYGFCSAVLVLESTFVDRYKESLELLDVGQNVNW